MATMKDITRIAQVSLSTVSHVVNGTKFVSPAISAKVQRVIEELNYTPSLVARNLKVKETNTIGMIVTASNNLSLRKWCDTLNATASATIIILSWLIPTAKNTI